MADNNLARSRNDVPDFFADGDPLAELARIVGYEERVVATPDPLPVPAASVAAERRDPVFNLEDELLREFERYDAPRLDPVDDVGVVEPQVQAFQRDSAEVEPFVDMSHSAASPSPAFESRMDDVSNNEPAIPAEPWHAGAVDAVSQAFARPSADVEHRAEDDGFDFLSPADLVSTEPEVELPISADVVSAPMFEQAPSNAQLDAYSDSAHAAFEAIDLAEELETSIVAPPVVQPVSELRRKESFTPSFRMPIANFRSGAGVVSDRPVMPKADVSAPAVPAPQAEDQSFQNWSFTAPAASAPIVTAAAEPLVSPAAPMAVPSMDLPLAGPAEPVARPAADPKTDADQFSALDELLYDVDRYSKAQHVDAPAVAAAPVVRDEPVAVAAPQPISPAVVAPSLEDDFDPFADVEFELALDDLELDLASMVGEENQKVAETVKAPVAAPAAGTPPVFAAAPSVAPSAPPVVSAPTFTAAPVAAAPVPVAPAVAAPVAPAVQPVHQAPVAPQVGQDDDLAFDPALIAESEEHPEAIAELDVPSLPSPDAEEPPLYRNDFDLDIDAELASLLEAPEAATSIRSDETRAQAVAAPGQPAVASASTPSIYADLDDFERALEEDFRRSLATPLQASDERHSDQGTYAPDLDDDQAGRTTRRWIAPLAAVGILAVCGAGAYAWLGNSGPGAGGNGEPIVIAADNDPVKVAPANPGGKTVPNQDKAVYDRVAGAASQAPRQEQLISSSEEPVDVVQKTLMPESLPLEGEDDVQMTDVSNTDDPRLLPQDQANGSQSADQQAVAVMPRKVKTMIVRADGTLVEQEIEAPAPAADVEKIAAAPVRADSPAAPQQSAAAFPTAAQSAPTAATPVSAPMDMAAASPAATVQPVSTEPAAIEQLAEPAEASNVRAPVPMTRPSQQPANVVAAVSDQGNVRPAPVAPAASAPAAQNTQVASVGAAGGYVIQIASLPSQADAQKSYQNLSNKFGSVIGGRGVDIKAAEIAGKGTFYRVRIPAGSKEQAVALCERYRSAGGSCLVAR